MSSAPVIMDNPPFARINYVKTFMEYIMSHISSFFVRHRLKIIAFSLTLCAISAHLFLQSSSPDAAFEAFTDTLFSQEVSSTTINLHYTLKHPENYDIQNIPITYGSFPTNSTAARAALENYLAALKKIPYYKLSSENKLTYDILKDYLNTARSGCSYLLYDEPLGPVTGLQAQLPVLLSEYQFHTQEDIHTYLQLLKTTPDYFQSLIDFEQAKSDNGLFMASYTADSVIEQCRSFLDSQPFNRICIIRAPDLRAVIEHARIKSCPSAGAVLERLSSVKHLSDAEKQSLIKDNEKIVNDFVFPSYEKLIDVLTSLKATSKNEGGICGLPSGQNYYEYIVQRDVGTDRNIRKLEELTLKQMQADLNAMRAALPAGQTKEVSASLNPAAYTTLEDTDPLHILSDLQSKITNVFPQYPDVQMNIKYVPKPMEEHLSPAFYMIPAIDNTDENTIYINQGQTMDGIELYTTLAHEGYPGHLYQTTYFLDCAPAPIRSILGYGGYTEGWATYAEMISFYFAPISKQEATLTQKNKSLILGIYALADMGIHYEGWTFEDTFAFFSKYGIANQSVVREIYELIVSDPANYLKYYIGYLEFLELKKDAMEQQGKNFSQKKFHEAILNAGPCSFPTLRKYVLK